MTKTAFADAHAPQTEVHAEPSDSIDTMYLTFPIGTELYGVSIGVVTEIVGLQRIMSVPDVPRYIKGVINLRGKVIPLMDVRLRFGMPEKAYDDRTVVIVLQVSDAPVGLIVDGVNEVLDIPASQIDRTHSFSGAEGRSLVMGLGRLEERVAILLDVNLLVEDDALMPPATVEA
ncbi:MAG: chemotaxis protein CheW [Roseovarius sp. BRH_c41]|jgi:purine-binding chemotaxis protein CheW|uniref:chemotaxis protein CheW n=1 Tax=Roseovarius sp. BRH_c41 TaxID=1629709 RepID=UPI0005F1DD0C|nr:chemotaxis protein CheW [Roseovarius sp. BRH_c41]KJS44157.1 MAG: chemotaxis protein CheW [Roseovarius sp. BRH_c41]